MGKVAKLLPEEYKQKAIDNKIPLQTVYRRLKNDWDIERAVTEKPNSRYIKGKIRGEEGEIIASDRPKSSKVIAFTAYADNQELLDKLIEQSGKSQSVFIADIIDDYLKSYEQK